MTRADAWLTLACVPGLYPAARRVLLEAFPDPVAACTAGADALTACGALTRDMATRLSVAVRDGVARRERARAAALGARIVDRDAPDFPGPLTDLPDPPAVLFVRGTLPGPDAVGVAIVGARRGTEWGRGFAEGLARGLAAEGCVVVSGGARGVDAAAHRGALAVGGTTVVVSGTGLGDPYPAEHARLFDAVAASGAVVSEMPCDTGPRAEHFPFRNRLIAGLAQAVVVVEATDKSGTFHTVNVAAELGRTVGAVPGRAGSATSAGCHQLLREGAVLVEHAADILAQLPLRPVRPGRTLAERPDSGADAPILVALGDEPAVLAELAARTGRPLGDLMAALSRLEMAGLVRALPGGRFTPSAPSA